MHCEPARWRATATLALALCGVACTKAEVIGPPAPASTPNTDATSRWRLDRSTIDDSIDPCVDFHRYTCGRWEAQTTLNPGQAYLERANDGAHRSIRAVLDELLLGTDASDNEDRARLRTFYRSCIAAETEDPRGLQTLAGWFATIDDARTSSDVYGLVWEFHRHGINVLFEYSGVPDPLDPSRHRGQLAQPVLTVGPNPSEPQQAQLREDITSTLVRSGVPHRKAKGASEPLARLELELARASLSWEDNEFQSPHTEHPMGLQPLQELAPQFDWESYLERVGAPKDRPLNIKSPTYLRELGHRWESTPLPTRALYLRWKLLDALGPALPPELRPTGGNPRPDYCERATLQALGVELSRQFALAALGPHGRERATAVAEAVRVRVVEAVEHNEWLSPSARASTARKLAATDLKIGYPDRWPATGSYALSPDAFVDNLLAARSYEQRRDWDRATRPRDRLSWEMKVRPNGAFGMAAARLTIPNGFPDQFTNSIVLPAASLVVPLFDPAAPSEVNFATLGYLVGHELLHVVENYLYDEQGRARTLWGPEDLAAQQQRLECIVDQADGFFVSADVHLDGEQTAEENIADFDGLRLAYVAMANELGDQLQEPGADGLTAEQRFFHAYAQRWCTKSSPEHEALILRSDWHAPPRFRVNGPLANMPRFAAALSCSPDAPMVRAPSERCSVW